MSAVYQQKITLSAGEECTISGTGVVELQLLSGVVEVAGVLLNAREPSVFLLENDRRCVIMYTLEGGFVQITADAPMETLKTEAKMADVVQLSRRVLAAERRSTVLVIGRSRSGKTLTAHTICNLLRENTAGESLGVHDASVFLMDLNAESNCVYAPGCISMVSVEHVLWPGTTSFPTMLPFSFFVGEAAFPSSETFMLFLHFVEQLRDCTEALMTEVNSERVHLVIDAPAPDPSIEERIYFRRIIEVLRPTHVVTVSLQDESEIWSRFLQEDVQRVFSDCEFFSSFPVARKCTASIRESQFLEYFAGTPSNPLGCAKVVLPLTQLQFVQYDTRLDEGMGVTCRKVMVTQDLVGCICALSHAEMLEEVSLAPVAGLLLILAIDEENEEVVAIVPASDDIPRRFVIVPNKTTLEVSTMSLPAVMSSIEDAVVL